MCTESDVTVVQVSGLQRFLMKGGAGNERLRRWIWTCTFSKQRMALRDEWWLGMLVGLPGRMRAPCISTAWRMMDGGVYSRSMRLIPTLIKVGFSSNASCTDLLLWAILSLWNWV
jgi:hypothetical protein